jgi:hypothetical protein
MSLTSILAGLVSVMIFSIATLGKYSLVLTGNPKTKVKSFSLMSFTEIGKKCFGVKGTLSLEYSAGLLFLSA